MNNFFLSHELQIEVSQISGMEDQITSHLSKHSISIESISIHTHENNNFVYLVTSDNHLASQILKKLPETKQVTENSVIFLEKKHWNNHLHLELSQALQRHHVSINHAYSASANNKPYFVLSTSNNHEAAQLISHAM